MNIFDKDKKTHKVNSSREIEFLRGHKKYLSSVAGSSFSVFRFSLTCIHFRMPSWNSLANLQRKQKYFKGRSTRSSYSTYLYTDQIFVASAATSTSTSVAKAKLSSPFRHISSCSFPRWRTLTDNVMDATNIFSATAWPRLLGNRSWCTWCSALQAIHRELSK